MRRLIGLTVTTLGCGPLVAADGDTDGSASSGDELGDDAVGEDEVGGIPPDPSAPGDPSVDPNPSVGDDGPSDDSSTGEVPDPCGDGVLDEGEGCDDGNKDDGDGCSSSCTFEGEPLWTASYNGPASSLDVANDVIIAPDGSIYVVGTHRVMASAPDLWLQQYLPDGSAGWTFSYDGDDGLGDEGEALAWTQGGQIAVVGTRESIASGDDVLVLLVDAASQQLLWARGFDGPSSGAGEFDDRDRGNDVAVDPSGNIVVAGTQRSVVDGDDTWVAELEPQDGALLWSIGFDFGEHEQAHALQVAGDGTMALLVEHDHDHAAITTILSDLGAPLGAEIVHPFAAHDLALRLGGGIALAGVGDEGFDREVVVAVLDESLSPSWQDEEDVDDSDDGIGVAAGPSGEVAVVGTRGASGQQTNAWLRVHDEDGTPRWSDTYDGSASLQDAFRAAAFDVDGTLVVVGSETVLGEQTNAIIRRYPAF